MSMVENVSFNGAVPLWVSIVSLVQVLLLLWLGVVVLIGSWKLFRWLLKWKP